MFVHGWSKGSKAWSQQGPVSDSGAASRRRRGRAAAPSAAVSAPGWARDGRWSSAMVDRTPRREPFGRAAGGESAGVERAMTFAHFRGERVVDHASNAKAISCGRLGGGGAGFGGHDRLPFGSQLRWGL